MQTSGQHCAVYGCSNNQKKRNAARKGQCSTHNVLQEDCGCNMYLLHRFPADAVLKHRWISAVNRKGFVPTESSRVCSVHFVDGKRTSENPEPMLQLGYARKVLKGRRRITKQDVQVPKKRAKENLVPQAAPSPSPPLTNVQQSNDSCSAGLQLLCSAALSEVQHSNDSCNAGLQLLCSAALSEVTQTKGSSVACVPQTKACFEAARMVQTPSTSISAEAGLPPTHHDKTTQTMAAADSNITARPQVQCTSSVQKHKSTQWENVNYEDHCYAQLPKIALHKTSFVEKLSADDILFYTGISQTAFNNLVKAVSTLAKKASILSRADQLMMCLMRLRLGLLYGHLGRIFQMSVSAVGNNIRYMFQVLCKVMKWVVNWLPREDIKDSMPASFTESGYGSTTCILDCTEVMLQRPKKLMARAQTFSSYKAHNTIKFLVAIAPNGHIMFVSKAYGGRASDKLITRESGIGDYFMRGDEVMADRGFSLDDELLVQGVRLNTPAFTKGKKQLTEKEVTTTRRIASVRIHVERAINRIKTGTPNQIKTNI
ncbi:uncharacterized protein [Dermacentor albipictus]|uniref:uncharacterized protein n=1 Tax=Dermacentor albipictus TaxID=60249 RepID=UPI0038FC5EB1